MQQQSKNPNEHDQGKDKCKRQKMEHVEVVAVNKCFISQKNSLMQKKEKRENIIVGNLVNH